MVRRLSVIASALVLTACMGPPTPLAPAIRGSIGFPHEGMITNAVQLPKKGDGYTLYRNNGRNWGNPRLVHAVASAAAQVARERPGGAKLVVGDISARYGGGSEGHRSHRTGRDADLLFYVVTPEGAPVPSAGFLHFGPDGLAKVAPGKYVRIDVEREWLLIKSLVTSSEANVQWLFFARWLEALVIEYARARGEDPEIVWRAENILLQPGDSAAHDDHLHLRIACTPEEAVAGCLGGGPYWPWIPQLPQLVPTKDGDLVDLPLTALEAPRRPSP